MSDVPGVADGGADEFEPGSGDDEITEEEDIEGSDAAGDGGDGEDAGDGEEEEREADDEGHARQVREPQRKESRYQRAIREAREAKREAQQLRERFEQAQRQPAHPQGPSQEELRRQEQQFLESLRLMDPTEAIIAVRDRERQQFSQVLQQVHVSSLDRQDRADFNAEARSDPAMARLKDQVEAAVTEARRLGNYAVTRKDIFYRMYGEEMAMRRQTDRPRQQREAKRRVERQTTRSVSGRGEGVRERAPAANSAEADAAAIAEMKRRGVPIW